MNVSKIPPLGVRMPPEMKDQLKHAAAVNHRSLNGEIVARLAASLERRYEDSRQDVGRGGLDHDAGKLMIESFAVILLTEVTPRAER